MITERTLRNWRRDALTRHSLADIYGKEGVKTELSGFARAFEESNERILRLTQELLDRYLMERSHQ